MRDRIIALSVLLLSLLSTVSEGASDQIVTVATRPSVTETAVVVRPPGKPAAILVVLVGGAGKLDLTPWGGLPRDAPGPLTKRREQLAGQGFVVAFVDAPSDRLGEGLLGFRASSEHSVDIARVIARLRHDAVPVWLVGMSMGAVSAASAAARLVRDGPDGLVLISSVTRTHPYMRESLGDVPLGSIQVPTLIVHHRQDMCETARYEDASALPRQLTGAKRVELVTLDGGPPTRGLPCGPESPHAFLGIEEVLIERVTSWIKQAPGR